MLDKFWKKKMTRKEFLEYSVISIIAGIDIGFGSYLFALPDRILDLGQPSELEIKIEENFNVKILGNPSMENLEQLDYMLQRARHDWDYFDYQLGFVNSILVKGLSQRIKYAGQTSGINRTIALNSIEVPVLIHELAHKYHTKMRHTKEFNKKWKSLLSEGYFNELFRLDNELSGKRSFSRYNLFEDIAELTAGVYGVKDLISVNYPLKSVSEWPKYTFGIQIMASSPETVANKLSLLAEYKFISSHEKEISEQILNLDWS